MKKSEELRQKLHEKHQFKPQPFKSARQASVTPPRAKAQGEDTGAKEDAVNGGAVSDFQARRDAFIKRQKERQL